MLRKSLCFTLVLMSLSVAKVRALELTANDETRAHWSFQPIQRPSIPFHTQATEQRNEIDTFTFYRLRQAGLQPAPVATKEALLRRAYYDLTGLPPSPAEVKAFLEDSSPLAFEFAVDRLHVRQLHATILHQLGFDPNHFTYFYHGLDEKLVGVEGAGPIQQIL